MALNSDGRWLAWGSFDDKAHLWDPAARKEREVFGRYGGSVSGDGPHLMTGNCNGTLYVLRLATK